MGISSIKRGMSDFWFKIYWIVVSNYYNLFYPYEGEGVDFTFPEWHNYDFDRYWDKETKEFFCGGLEEDVDG